ncbi:MAG TPA: barstar family protein [Kofleriaceae bacterium]
MPAKPVFELDGTRVDSLDGFYDEVTATLGLSPWGRNLDAFNDILRGGFGTPDGGFVLRWTNSARSRDTLGYAATVQMIESKLLRCHPTNVASVQADLEAARRGEGQTVFEILVEIIRRHGPDDGIELELD